MITPEELDAMEALRGKAIGQLQGGQTAAQTALSRDMVILIAEVGAAAKSRDVAMVAAVLLGQRWTGFTDVAIAEARKLLALAKGGDD